MKTKIKSGDIVYVTTGKDKGKTGKVLKLLKAKNKVIVEKVNVVKRHSKPTQQNQTGGIIEKELGIDISNIMLLDPESNSPTRVGYKVNEIGKKLRISKKSGEEL
jgi:large subunit ribosomal protein L24